MYLVIMFYDWWDDTLAGTTGNRNILMSMNNIRILCGFRS